MQQDTEGFRVSGFLSRFRVFARPEGNSICYTVTEIVDVTRFTFKRGDATTLRSLFPV